MNPQHLETIKDLILLKLLVERGGTYAMTYDEFLQIGQEFDGWAVRLEGNMKQMVVKVATRESNLVQTLLGQP